MHGAHYARVASTGACGGRTWREAWARRCWQGSSRSAGEDAMPIHAPSRSRRKGLRRSKRCSRHKVAVVARRMRISDTPNPALLRGRGGTPIQLVRLSTEERGDLELLVPLVVGEQVVGT